MEIKLRLAERANCKASILIEGTQGSGKSGLALMIAHALTGDWKKVVAADTENKSLDLFVNTVLSDGSLVESFNKFDITSEVGFKPEMYKAVRQAGLDAGCEACVCDSITHMWQQKGGVLDLVNNLGVKDKYSAWGDPRVVQAKQDIYDIIRHSDIHCINTVRVKEKQEYVDDLEHPGKKKLLSLGEQPMQMPDLKYEPDLVLSMQEPGTESKNPVVLVTKSRYRIFNRDEEYEITPKVLQMLKEYLSEGTSPETLLEQQRQDYIDMLNSLLKDDPVKQVLWKNMKVADGIKDTKLEDMSLDTMKKYLGALIS